MGQNLTLNNGESGYLLNSDSFSGDRFSWYTGTNNGAIRLQIAVSNMDRVNHKATITATWTWHATSGSGKWCWDHNSGLKYYILTTTGTSSSSGTSKTYYLYRGGNKHSYGTYTTLTNGFNWAAAYSRGSDTWGDPNYNVSQGSIENTTVVDLAEDNSLTMSIACKLTGTSGGYGPRSTKTWTTYTLTIPASGAFMWVNDNGTWKKGIAWVNDNGTWKEGLGTYYNSDGTWKDGKR